jgi:uncharacterized protein (TIGR02246 family)
MSLDLLALTSRYHDALNHYDEATVKAMFAPDAVYVSKGVNGRIAGRDAILAAFTAYFDEHPDQHAEDEGVEVLSPNMVRFAWRLRATARSSGKPVTRRGVETVNYDGDGLISHVEVIDT